MVSPKRGAWRLTFGSSHEIPGFVKLLMPPQQSWGISYVCLGAIAEVHEGELRVTCNQNLMIANVRPEKRAEIERLVAEYGLDDGHHGSALRLHAMACVAFPTCGLAMAESERFLPGFVRRLEDVMAELGLREVPINLRVTGCPNGCARPYLGEIGLTGKALGKYNLYLGADFSGQRMNRLYRENIDEAHILDTLKPLLARFARERGNEEHFGDFLIRTGIIEAERTPAMFHQALPNQEGP